MHHGKAARRCSVNLLLLMMMMHPMLADLKQA